MRIPFEIFAPYFREHFYLDPGSGSFLIQLLLAALIGSAFAIKVYWKKIKAFFENVGKAEKISLNEVKERVARPEVDYFKTDNKSEGAAAVVEPGVSDPTVADPSVEPPDEEKLNEQP